MRITNRYRITLKNKTCTHFRINLKHYLCDPTIICSKPYNIAAVMSEHTEIPARPPGNPGHQLLCLTICGYRRPGMNEEDYKNHMTKVSAPMTRDLMIKYGVKRWTQVSPSLPDFRPTP